MTLPVSESFVKEAHAAACADWKKRIEQEFPQIFDTLSKVRALPEYEAYRSASWSGANIKLMNSDQLEIALPNNNKDWTFAAWDLAKAVCQAFPSAFPRHVGEPNRILIERVK